MRRIVVDNNPYGIYIVLFRTPKTNPGWQVGIKGEGIYSRLLTSREVAESVARKAIRYMDSEFSGILERPLVLEEGQTLSSNQARRILGLPRMWEESELEDFTRIHQTMRSLLAE